MRSALYWRKYGIIMGEGSECMPKIVPIHDLKDTNAISKMCAESSEPIYVTKNGYGDMVIMSMKTYDEYMLRQEIYQKLSVAEEDFHSGNVMDAEESLQKLRQKYPHANTNLSKPLTSKKRSPRSSFS